jgi:hypothetical protein
MIINQNNNNITTNYQTTIKTSREKDPLEVKDEVLLGTNKYSGDDINNNMFTLLSSGKKWAGAPDHSAGGWVSDKKWVGAPDHSAGGWVSENPETSGYPGDAISGKGSSTSENTLTAEPGTFVGAPDHSAGGWIPDKKWVGAPDHSAGGWVSLKSESSYPGDAISGIS